MHRVTVAVQRAIALLACCLLLQEDEDEAAAKAISPPVNTPVVAATYLEIFRFWSTSPSLILLCIVGGIRNAGGYVWAYQCSKYFKGVRNVSDGAYSIYMLWIPLIGGSMGAVLGGFISDKFVRARATMRASLASFLVLCLSPAPLCSLFVAPQPEL